MTKHISDWEKLLQMTLNRKYTEIEEKDKIILQLQRELSCLKLRISEDKETIYNLCNQINRLIKKNKEMEKQFNNNFYTKETKNTDDIIEGIIIEEKNGD